MTTDLIHRLEAASEGSRELSDEVLLAFGWTCVGQYWSEPGLFAVVAGPNVTTSLDAAMSLIPKDVFFWTVDASGYAGIRSLDSEGNWTHVDAATPALALCAAALRAREMMKETASTEEATP